MILQLQEKQVCEKFAKLTKVLNSVFILINTNIDPRKLSLLVATKYKNKDFCCEWGEPQYQMNKEGTQSSSLFLNVKEVAYSRSALATIKFKFSKLK